MNEAAAKAGARLMRAREQRHLSVEKAASELHLEPWVIESLEAGDYARVGPVVYGKGYLRRYATFLELPPEEILAEFGLGAPTPPESSGTTPESPPTAAVSAGQMLGGVAVALLVGGLVWWKPWVSSTKDSLPAPPAEPAATLRAPEIEPETPDASAGEPLAAPARSALSASTAGTRPHPAAADHGADAVAASDAPVEPGAGRARLRLSFTADSWVDVRDAQGNKTFVGNGSANTVHSIAGQAPMHVYLRSGSGVQLEINGHAVAIGPQFFAGDAARFQVGADGVLRREPREASASNGHPPS